MSSPILYHKIIGEGRPLFILHGLFGSSDNWGTLSKRFAEDRQVILVDQRNHGHSFHAPEMDYEHMAQDLLGLMDELGIEKADWLGHSMGGKSVMRAAMMAPERVNRLIVADIGPQEYQAHHDAIFNALHSVPIDTVPSRSKAIVYMSEHIESQGMMQFLGKNLYWVEKGKLAWRMNLPVIAEHMPDILASVGTQEYAGDTLFVRGGESDYIQDEDKMAIQVQFSQSEIVSMEGVGHWLHAEQPEQFYKIVHHYLDV